MTGAYWCEIYLRVYYHSVGLALFIQYVGMREPLARDKR